MQAASISQFRLLPVVARYRGCAHTCQRFTATSLRVEEWRREFFLQGLSQTVSITYLIYSTSPLQVGSIEAHSGYGACRSWRVYRQRSDVGQCWH